MKGIDINDDQMRAAETFLLERQEPPCKARTGDVLVGMRWKDLVRLVAWYGAVRAEGALKGIPVDKPGEPVEVAP